MRLCEQIKWFIAKSVKTICNPAALKNCKLDKNTWVGRGSDLTNVEMGRYSSVDRYCFLVDVKIGNFSGISADCVIGASTHPMDHVSTSFTFYGGKNALHKNWSNYNPLTTEITTIENDVWIGQGSFIKPGVTIHNGAVVGMGSVVTHDIPAYELWAGNPARKIRDRFDKEMARQIENAEWWNWSDEKIYKFANDFENPSGFLEKMKEE